MAHAERWRAWVERRLVPLRAKLSARSRALREILFGMTVHEMDVMLRKEKGTLDQLFLLVVFGDLVGLPLLPPYYSMRLLPYVLPSIARWKRSLFREKDITDLASQDL